MTSQAHGTRPAGHEHAFCRFCGAECVHVRPGRGGRIEYDGHTREGCTVACLARTYEVWPEHRKGTAPCPAEDSTATSPRSGSSPQ